MERMTPRKNTVAGKSPKRHSDRNIKPLPIILALYWTYNVNPAKSLRNRCLLDKILKGIVGVT